MKNEELKVVELGTAENKWNKLYFRTLSKGYTLEEIEKQLKALEIIKEKKWLVEDILNSFLEDKDKYDLLKEALV